MTGWLHLGSESFRGDDEAEVSLAGSATLHGLMVGMEVRVIEDLECRRLQGGGDLEEGNGILFSRSSPSAGVHTLQSMCFWVGGGKGVGGGREDSMSSGWKDESRTFSRMVSSTGVWGVAMLDSGRRVAALARLTALRRNMDRPRSEVL